MLSETEPTTIETPVTATKNGITLTTTIKTERAVDETAAQQSARHVEQVETHAAELLDKGWVINSETP